MDWTKIPSLFALRAFEAVVRCESFTGAARELNVTHAAISQHVRSLENDFATPLLQKRGRKMEPTEAGRQLASSLNDGFSRIAAAVDTLRAEQAERPLSITSTPSFAENWLMPRLGSFWAAHPEIRVSLNPSVALSDLSRDGYDLAIRYGKGQWSGYQITKLASAKFYAVATPELTERHGLEPGADLTHLPWFFETLSGEHRRWAEDQGLISDHTRVETFETIALTMSAVRAHYGLTVSSQALVENDIAAGRLVALAEGGSEELGYFILTPKAGASPNARKFITWLKRNA